MSKTVSYEQDDDDDDDNNNNNNMRDLELSQRSAEIKVFCLDCLTPSEGTTFFRNVDAVTHCNVPEHLDLQYQRCKLSEKDTEPAGSCLRLLFVEFLLPLSSPSVLFPSAATVLGRWQYGCGVCS